MSDLSFLEKRQFENLLGMSTGYVSDFSNNTFEEFVADAVGKEIYSQKYEHASGSKANRLRAFWKVESNHLVGRLMDAMLDYEVMRGAATEHSDLIEASRKTVRRLLEGAPVADLDAIAPNSKGRAFDALARSVRDSIDNNEPEAGLDRLHTFVVKYIRTVCEKHGISTGKDKPLHSLFGEYVKFLNSGGYLSATMTERILKTNISILESFNHVRNEQSFAHDNELLGYDESLLIYNNICSLIKFLEALEERIDRDAEAKAQPSDLFNELPF